MILCEAEEEEEEDWEVLEIILVDGDIKFFHAYLFLLYLFLVCYELSLKYGI